MLTVAEVQKINDELGRKINEEARRDPASPYAGKFVGLANGKVVVVTEDLDEVCRRLEEADPDPQRCFIIEASRDYDEVHDIWELP